ncbi:hypothetical protein G6F68_018906 [Rhizopus microsporus]|nr:hypothetical protein G6F68_018906 [Rhizopus microsporus]
MARDPGLGQCARPADLARQPPPRPPRTGAGRLPGSWPVGRTRGSGRPGDEQPQAGDPVARLCRRLVVGAGRRRAVGG